MKDTFPYLEPLGALPDVQKKMLAAYDLVGYGCCNFPFLPPRLWEALKA